MAEKESEVNLGESRAAIVRFPKCGVVTVGWIVAGAGGIASTAMLLTAIIVGGRVRPEWIILWALVPAAALILFRFIRRSQQCTDRAMRLLRDLAEDARVGILPMDDLDQFDGELGQLALTIQNLLKDNRKQRQAMAVLEAEMGVRLANRTDALERSIAGLKSQATRDALTGLYNRRMLDESIPKIVEQCRSQKMALCLLMIDVDYFKLLNDTLGHAAGDEMLKNIGQLIRSAIREGDMAFRHGGDEFVIVLPGVARSEGSGLAQRIASLVDALAKPLRVSHKPRLSIGVASLDEIGDRTSTSLLKAGDEDLYAVKSARKSRRTPLPSGAR